jgi:hypothetical protein
MENLNLNNSHKIVNLREKNIDKLEEDRKDKKNKEEIKEILSWKTFDFTEDTDKARWLKLAVIISFVIFIGALWTKNFITAITFFLLTLVIFMNSRAKSKEIEAIITSKGIIVGEQNYFFDDLESFWIIEDRNPTIILKSKKFFMPYAEIYLADQNPDNIREILKKRLKEKKEEESFLKDISRVIKI